MHLGIVLVALAIATSQARTIEAERTLSPDGPMTVAGYSVMLDALRTVTEPQRRRVVADLRISGASGEERLAPALTFYPNATQAIGSPGIRAGAGDDVYAILAQREEWREVVETWRVFLDVGEFHPAATMVRPLYEDARRKLGGP